MKRTPFLGLLLLLLLAGCEDSPAGPERPRITVAVPGATNVAFLPLMVAQEEGFFRRQGLEVEILDAASGAEARQLLLDGEADAVMGFYEHTIQLQAEGRDILGVVLVANRPGLVLAVRAGLSAQIRQVSDLRGRRVGISSPGSGTHNFLNYLLARANIAPSEVTLVAVGLGSTAIQAIETGQVDALVSLDPTITTLVLRQLVNVLVDTRTEAGVRDAYGGTYASTVIYTHRDFTQRNPGTTQRLVNATLAATAWLQSTAPEQVVTRLGLATDVPGRQLWVQVIASSQGMFSSEGRFVEADVQRVLGALRLTDPRVAGAQLDLGRTYTNRFVDAAR